MDPPVAASAVASPSGRQNRRAKTAAGVLLWLLRRHLQIPRSGTMSAGEPCVQRVLMSLRDPDVGRITLYGLGGIGKTWAARRAMDWAEQASFFHITVWVSLSAGSTLRQVQKMILERLPASVRGDDDDDHDDEEEIPWRGWQVNAALHGTKFLLILDNLWLTEENVLGAIGVPTHDPAVGSKVLVTTRSRRVLTTTQPDLRIEMAGLPFRESLELFLEAAGGAAADSLSLQPLVHEVVRRCLGIPLAIVLVGRALRGNIDAPSQERTLMAASSCLGQGTCNMVVYSAVKLAYRFLPGDAAREFLVIKCALFDRGVVVEAQDPVRRYSLEKMMEQIGTSVVDGAHENFQSTFTELLNRRLLFEDGDGRIIAQNVIREVLLDIGRESDRFYLTAGPDIDCPPSENVWRSYGTIALVDTMVEALPDSPGPCPGLSTLLLNGNHRLTRIPQGFFSRMERLSVLDLSDTRIEYLPFSFLALSELRVLLLRRCVCLEEVTNIDYCSKLEVLDLSGATRMKRIVWVPWSPAARCLAVVNLSESSVEDLQFLVGLGNLRQLLLSGCRRLRSALQLSSLTKLERLDLSGTTLMGFPSGISELTQLKHLRLAGAKYTTVEWRMIHWLPPGLQWDQSSGSDITIEPVQNGDSTAFISTHDSRVFSSLERNSPLWRSCFKKFHFCLCHPDAADDVRFQKKGFVFRDAYFKTRHFARPERRDRHLQISGVHVSPQCIEGVLFNSELVALNSIKSVKRLSDLGLADMKGMKECWIERCDQMETVLDDQEVEFLGTEGSLECLWVSNSTSLASLFGKMGRAGNFVCLKHLNLDCCPNLICVFSSAVRLQNLETFQVKFCDGLETVFGEPVSGEDALPRLHTMRLWELPQLKYITDGVLPDLQNLKVRQCPMLTKIPVGTSDMSPLVRITGESWWWNNLKWDGQAVKYHLLFRRWGRF